MHGPLTVLVKEKRFDWEWEKRRTFFYKHRCHLPLSGAVNACIGPPLFPTIQIRLRLFQALEAQPFQRCLFRMADTRFHFALAIWISYAAWHSDGAIVLEQIAV